MGIQVCCSITLNIGSDSRKRKIILRKAKLGRQLGSLMVLYIRNWLWGLPVAASIASAVASGKRGHGKLGNTNSRQGDNWPLGMQLFPTSPHWLAHI
jgi:hypothetical protein